MGLIEFEVADGVERVLRKEGIDPAELARSALEAAARQLDAEEQRRALDAYSRKPSVPLADLIREIRDEH